MLPLSKKGWVGGGEEGVERDGRNREQESGVSWMYT